MIYSTLRGTLAAVHPEIRRLVSVDGEVCMRPAKPVGKYYTCRWTKGTVSTQRNKKYKCLVVFIHRKCYVIARLVAECFVPNPEHKPTVDHWNRDPTDNRVSNLRWASYKEQIENSGTVLNRTDYGVRPCEDLKAYCHNRYMALKQAKTQSP